MAAIVVENLTRSYGALPAVAGISFTVQRGEVFALLGPNGAGKARLLGGVLERRVANAVLGEGGAQARCHLLGASSTGSRPRRPSCPGRCGPSTLTETGRTA